MLAYFYITFTINISSSPRKEHRANAGLPLHSFVCYVVDVMCTTRALRCRRCRPGLCHSRRMRRVRSEIDPYNTPNMRTSNSRWLDDYTEFITTYAHSTSIYRVQYYICALDMLCVCVPCCVCLLNKTTLVWRGRTSLHNIVYTYMVGHHKYSATFVHYHHHKHV